MTAKSLTLSTRLAVTIEQYKKNEHNQLKKTLQALNKDLVSFLAPYDFENINRREGKRVVNEVRNIARKSLDKYSSDFLSNLNQIGLYNANMQIKIISLVKKEKFKSPKLSVIDDLIKNSPLATTGSYKGKLTQEVISDWVDNTVRGISGLVRLGVYEKKPTNQIIKEIRGTKANKYKDGGIFRALKNGITDINTTVQHVNAISSKHSIISSLGEGTKVRFISILDSVTSLCCASLSQRVFNIEEAPIPPLHPNCRSWLDFNVDESEGQSFFEWLQDQPESFQNQSIGVTRAKLLREGGMTADEFAALNLNRNFKPLTLVQMKNIAPKIFENAKIN
jgi:hypothetical protein